MPYVQSITNVLTTYLGWHRARLKFIARFQAAVLMRQTTNLAKLAASLKGGVQIASNYRRIQWRIQRFLSGYEVDFTALGRLLVHLLPQNEPYVAVLDRTEWHVGNTPVNILMIGVAHDGVAVPIAWKVLPNGGGSGSEAHIRVLERFLAIVDPEAIRAVVADREFIGVEWLLTLQEQDIPFAIRLRSNRRIGYSEGHSGEGHSGEGHSGEGHSGEGPALPVRMFARPVALGTDASHAERVLDGDRYLIGTDGQKVPVRVVIRRIASGDTDDPFLIVATYKLAATEALALYRKRWEIETLFAALKSRGYDLEATHVTEPGRMQRLLGLLALTFAWTHLVGEKRALWDGPPPKKAHERRAKSLFRYGLDWLQHLLTTPERQDAALFRCLSLLQRPTAHLPCG